jgi:hypothetical protein
MKWGEITMSIFTPEYIVLAVALLVVVYHMIKKPNASEESGESPMNNGKGKRLQ